MKKQKVTKLSPIEKKMQSIRMKKIKIDPIIDKSESNPMKSIENEFNAVMWNIHNIHNVHEIHKIDD